MDPSFAQNFQSFVALAPITSIEKQLSPLGPYVAYSYFIDIMMSLGIGSFCFFSNEAVTPWIG